MKTLKAIALAGALVFSMQVSAQISPEVTQLQHDWAHIRYEIPQQDREAAFKQLADQARQRLVEEPDSAECMTWAGIILSTYAGEKGGLGALSLVKEARQLFEAAIERDPQVLDGSALTSLGSLYYQVPGWPIGFGDDDKAREYLERGLAFNPQGIDANYFYADFLAEQHEYSQARQLLKTALQAPARASRPIADQGRRAEIQALLAKINHSE